MDKVIKEGTLRVLISESTCDVILSCNGHRLMAHKLILSIASPVFRELLQKTFTDSTTVIILPDISGSIMSTILDYIYTGTTIVYTHSLQEFLSAAIFLQIAVDTTSVEDILGNLQKVNVKKLDVSCSKRKSDDSNHGRHVENIEYCKMDVKKQDVDNTSLKTFEESIVETELCAQKLESEVFQPKCQKKMPDLLPIGCKAFRKINQRKMCNAVVPSPWCQRNDRAFLGDPRDVAMISSENEMLESHEEDTNNNCQPFQNIEASKSSSKNLETIVRHLYLNNIDVNKERTARDYTKRKKLTSHFLGHCAKYSNDLPKVFDNAKPSVTSLVSNLPTPKTVKTANTNSDKCDILDNKCNDFTSQSPRTLHSAFNLKHFQPQKSLSLDFAQNLSLSNKNISTSLSSPTNLPHSSIATRFSPTILNIPLTSPIKDRDDKKTENSNSLSDVINDNSNDPSSESSSDEKKEEEVDVKKKSYKCEDCGKSFSQLRNYKYHRSIHEGTKEFSAKCPECGKMFNDRGYLSSHMKIHRDKKEYACPNCPKRFNQRVAYNMHLRIHTGVKPHACPTCGKSFSRKMLLKQHERVHTGERPYTCPECGKTFADRSNMSLHARLHTGVKPYACNLCPKSFTKKHHLKTHMNFHTGLKPYTCENCGLAFSQSSNMRTHYKKCVLRESFGKSTSKAESVGSSAENNSS